MDLLGFFLPNCGGNLTLYADLFHGGKMLMSDVGLCCHVDEEHAVEAKNGVLILYSNYYYYFFVFRKNSLHTGKLLAFSDFGKD